MARSGWANCDVGDGDPAFRLPFSMPLPFESALEVQPEPVLLIARSLPTLVAVLLLEKLVADFIKRLVLGSSFGSCLVWRSASVMT